MSDDAAKSPLDHALDLVLFAPLGFALEAHDLVPQLVDRGREQFATKVTMAKMVGQFAVKHGQAEATKHITKVHGTATSALSDLGVTPKAAPSSPGDGPAPEAARCAQPLRPAAGASDALPIHDYDSLAASQVIPRLDGLDAHELEAVRAYEAAGRGRKTILGKIAQLQG